MPTRSDAIIPATWASNSTSLPIALHTQAPNATSPEVLRPSQHSRNSLAERLFVHDLPGDVTLLRRLLLFGLEAAALESWLLDQGLLSHLLRFPRQTAEGTRLRSLSLIEHMGPKGLLWQGGKWRTRAGCVMMDVHRNRLPKPGSFTFGRSGSFSSAGGGGPGVAFKCISSS